MTGEPVVKKANIFLARAAAFRYPTSVCQTKYLSCLAGAGACSYIDNCYNMNTRPVSEHFAEGEVQALLTD